MIIIAESNKHSFKTEYQDSLGLAVYYCGFHQCEPGHSFGPALKNHHIIHVIESGQGTFTIDGKQYVLSSGDIFYCPEKQIVSYAADQNNPWKYYWVGFSGIDSYGLLDAAGLSVSAPVKKTAYADILIQRITEIYEANGNNLHNEAEMCGDLYRFFSILIKENSSRNKETPRRNINYVEVATKFIEHNYSRQISISDVADSAGISRSHLYRLFMQETGVTPNEFLLQYRINNACKLLTQTDLNISEAAYSSGFSDPLYFSRVFIKFKGITPSLYSKRKN